MVTEPECTTETAAVIVAEVIRLAIRQSEIRARSRDWHAIAVMDVHRQIIGAIV